MRAKSSLPNIIAVIIISIIHLTYLPKNHAVFSKTITREQLNLTRTHLSFYFRDVVSGPNPTVTLIANASTSDTSPTSFGSLVMIDDSLTEGPETTSRLVGRAQGMYGSVDQRVSTAIMVVCFVLLEGEYDGSSLSVLGRNQVLEGVRELPVVGGTGVFRFAKGYAQARTHSLDNKTGDAVVRYDVYVSHAGSMTTFVESSGSKGGSGSSGSSLSVVTVLFVLFVPIIVL